MGFRVIAALFACLLASGAVAQDVSVSAAFSKLLQDHWQRAEQEQVFFRTDPDAYRPDGKLAEVSTQALARRRAFNESMLARLATIDEAELKGEDRISYFLFGYEREAERESYQYPGHLFPFTSLFGYQSYFAEAPAKMAFNDAADYERYIVSLADFPRYNREHIQLLEQAVELGYTHYCESMAGYGATISSLIVDRPDRKSVV